MKDVEMLKNVNLQKYNTYGIGGTCKYLIKPKSIMELKDTLKRLKEEKISWYILGSGSNVILPDTDYNGAIIKLDNMQDFAIDNDLITVSSGMLLSVFINKMLELGYTNYASLMGIPGTIGGAIVGNAGVKGITIFDYLVSVKVLEPNGDIIILNKEDIDYTYRNTEFKGTKRIILEATFKGIKGNALEAREKIKETLEKRKNTQPLEYKNAGSVFKNPDGCAAGAIIEQTGLKGLQIGDAQVSEKHANFIINLGNAKSSDIINLIKEIKDKVKEAYNIDLELEQIIVKW